MRIEDVYDLNEQNVKKFLKYIKARPEDNKDVSVGSSQPFFVGSNEPISVGKLRANL